MLIKNKSVDWSGGLKKRKDSVKVLEDICLEHDLLYIWRISQKTPIIQRRLAFWLISDGLQDDVVSVDIKPSITSDHLALTLLFTIVWMIVNVVQVFGNLTLP